jgi:hypothetical protein
VYCSAVATSGPLSLVGLGPQVHALPLLARPQVAGAGLVEGQLLCNGSKELTHILARLCRRLEKQKAGLAGILLGVCRLDGALVRRLGDQIELVTG